MNGSERIRLEEKRKTYQRLGYSVQALGTMLAFGYQPIQWAMEKVMVFNHLDISPIGHFLTYNMGDLSETYAIAAFLAGWHLKKPAIALGALALATAEIAPLNQGLTSLIALTTHLSYKPGNPDLWDIPIGIAGIIAGTLVGNLSWNLRHKQLTQ